MSSTVDVLPNSLTRDKKIDISMSRNGQEWFYLFCASCGKEGGRVLKTDVPNREEFACWICNECAETYGGLPIGWSCPDELFWQKVREAQLERHKRELTLSETLKELENPSSYLHQLARDRNTFLASE